MKEKNQIPGIHCCYSRAEAIEDELQVDVSDLGAEAGIRFPVFMTLTVYERFVTVPEGVEAQDEDGRLWDILWMLKFAIRRAPADTRRLPFELYVRNSNEKGAELVTLAAVCGPVDIHDPRPAITILMPDED